MSARQWKSRLEECQSKLTESTIAAREWKQVADNRLLLLHRLDESITKQLSALKGMGNIFGVKVDLEEEVWTSTIGMDASGTAMYIMGKIEATSLCLSDLMKEASQIQVTLHDTYTLACDAITIERPVTDLTIPDDIHLTDLPSSPLKEFNTGMNDTAPPSQVGWQGDQEIVLRPKVEDVFPGHARALDLFKN